MSLRNFVAAICPFAMGGFVFAGCKAVHAPDVSSYMFGIAAFAFGLLLAAATSRICACMKQQTEVLQRIEAYQMADNNNPLK
jgi:hypothetical protein